MAETLGEQLRVAKERYVVLVEAGLPHGGRADILAYRPGHGKHDITVYEIKVSRADFLADLNEGKYRRYFPSCHRLFFVTPAGLVKRNEVPDQCGLMTQQPHGGFRVVKPALRREMEPLDAEWLWSLVEQAWFRDVPAQRRIKDRLIAGENGELRVQSWRLGQEVARAMWEAEDARKSGTSSVEARNAIYLAQRLIELAAAAGISGRWFGSTEDVTEGDLAHLAESAVKLIEATDRVQQIGRYLSNLNVGEGGRLDAKLVAFPVDRENEG